MAFEPGRHHVVVGRDVRVVLRVDHVQGLVQCSAQADIEAVRYDGGVEVRGISEAFCNLDRGVRRAVIEDDDSTRAQGLLLDGLEALGDVALVVV